MWHNICALTMYRSFECMTPCLIVLKAADRLTLDMQLGFVYESLGLFKVYGQYESDDIGYFAP